MPEHIDVAVFGYWAVVGIFTGVLVWLVIRNEPPRSA